MLGYYGNLIIKCAPLAELCYLYLLLLSLRSLRFRLLFSITYFFGFQIVLYCTECCALSLIIAYFAIYFAILSFFFY